MDQRERKSKKAAYEAFKNLLSQKPYGEITVNEIISNAHIGRATFYKHFKSKEDLFENLCQETFAHIFDLDLAKEATHDFSHKEDASSSITHLLIHIKEGKNDLLKALGYEGGEAFYPFFRRCLDKYLPRKIEKLDKPTPDIPDDLRIRLLSESFLAILRYWGNEGFKSEPSLIGKYYLEATKSLVRW